MPTPGSAAVPPPRPGTPPTIADVARVAAVSKTTASDALRGHGAVRTVPVELNVRASTRAW